MVVNDNRGSKDNIRAPTSLCCVVSVIASRGAVGDHLSSIVDPLRLDSFGLS